MTASETSGGRSPPRIEVIILAHNGARLIEDCLSSIMSLDYPNYGITVVDNHSLDETAFIVKDKFPIVKLITSQENEGFSKAYNKVIAASYAEYVLLLNQDTVVPQSDLLQKLLEGFATNSSVAACSPKILFRGDPQIINSVGGAAYWWTGSFDIGFGEHDLGQFESDDFEPFAFCGAAALLKRKEFLDVGGFDEGMFSYVEDFDLSWRMRLRGLKVKYVWDAEVLHEGSASWGRGSETQIYLTVRNFLRALLKNYGAFNVVRGLPYFLLQNGLIKPIGYLFVKKDTHGFFAFYKAIIWNMETLGSTLKERQAIQRTRVVDDRDLLKLMGTHGSEPLAHLARRTRKPRIY